jgi:L-asparagine oxygenase
MYGLEAFPLHTDMAHWHIPPRYFLLRCLQAAHQVDTLAVHFREILGEEDEATLRRAIFRPRRRLEGRLTSMRLKEDARCRWDPVFIVPVTEEARRLRERVVQRISTANVAKVKLSDATDCLLFDNWNVLHGRSAVPTDALHRKIERVYLESLIP